jgi:hypothetical protein
LFDKEKRADVIKQIVDNVLKLNSYWLSKVMNWY